MVNMGFLIGYECSLWHIIVMEFNLDPYTVIIMEIIKCWTQHLEAAASTPDPWQCFLPYGITVKGVLILFLMQIIIIYNTYSYFTLASLK